MPPDAEETAGQTNLRWGEGPHEPVKGKLTLWPMPPDNALAKIRNRLKVVLKIPTNKRPILVNSKATPTHLVKASNPTSNRVKINNLAKISRHKQANPAAEITPSLHPMGRGPERGATKAVTLNLPNRIAMVDVVAALIAAAGPCQLVAPKAATSVAV